MSSMPLLSKTETFEVFTWFVRILPMFVIMSYAIIAMDPSSPSSTNSTSVKASVSETQKIESNLSPLNKELNQAIFLNENITEIDCGFGSNGSEFRYTHQLLCDVWLFSPKNKRYRTAVDAGNAASDADLSFTLGREKIGFPPKLTLNLGNGNENSAYISQKQVLDALKTVIFIENNHVRNGDFSMPSKSNQDSWSKEDFQ